MSGVSTEPLQALFRELVDKNYSVVGLHDQKVTDYVVRLLDEFSTTRRLFRIRNAAGESLTTVGEMLLASNPIYGGADSFEREREVRRHIGDFALFFTGMFPESLRARRIGYCLESLLDYVAAGKESYHIVSEYERSRPEEFPTQPVASGDEIGLAAGEGGARKEAELFEKLSHEFELCMYGLNLVKSELESFSDPVYEEVRRLLT
jgi:hypothetical protein